MHDCSSMIHIAYCLICILIPKKSPQSYLYHFSNLGKGVFILISWKTEIIVIMYYKSLVYFSIQIEEYILVM